MAPAAASSKARTLAERSRCFGSWEARFMRYFACKTTDRVQPDFPRSLDKEVRLRARRGLRPSLGICTPDLRRAEAARQFAAAFSNLHNSWKVPISPSDAFLGESDGSRPYLLVRWRNHRDKNRTKKPKATATRTAPALALEATNECSPAALRALVQVGASRLAHSLQDRFRDPYHLTPRSASGVFG